jgi:glycosyltransferase involved in cell wall biosynthesis
MNTSTPLVAHCLLHSFEGYYPKFFTPGKSIDDFDREILAQQDGWAHALMAATTAAGFEPVLYYFSAFAHKPGELRHKLGHRMVRVPAINPREPRRKRRVSWEYSPALIRHLLRERPALVHIHDYNHNDRVPDMYDLLAPFLRWQKIPFVAHFHGSTSLKMHGLRRAIKRRTIEEASHLVTCNMVEISRLCDPAAPGYYGFSGIQRSRVEKFHDVIDLNLFRPLDRTECRLRLGLEPEATYLLSVGRLIELKRFEDLIELMTHLPEHCKLLIAGDGEHRPVLERRIHELGVGDRVTLVGSIHNTDLPTYYNAADIFLLASRSEGLPVTIMEALSCRTPVIATRLDGMVDLLSDGIGQMVPVGDIAALAEATQAVLSGQFEPNWPEAQRRLRQHSFDVAVAHLKRLYTSMLVGR